MLKNSLIETYIRLQSIDSYPELHAKSFEEFFNKLCEYDCQLPFGLNILNQFLNENINLIPVGTINQRSWTIDNYVDYASYYSIKNEVFKKNQYYLNENGLSLQLSEDAENARIIFNGNGILTGQIDNAKLLLKEYHQNFPN